MTQPAQAVLSDLQQHLRVLSHLIAQCYRDGFVPPEVASAASVILPNVAWLGYVTSHLTTRQASSSRVAHSTNHRLSLPYQDHEGDHYIVSVNNLASSGTTRMTCLAAPDTAATLAIRNAVPCISSMYGSCTIP